MGKNFTICVGTLGMGLWRSADGGRKLGPGQVVERIPGRKVRIRLGGASERPTRHLCRCR